MAWSPGIWKRGSLHRTLLTGCSEVQCKLPLSIADGLLIIDEHKSGSFQILGVEVSRRGGCNNSISVTVCQNRSPLLTYQTVAFALSNPFLNLFQEDFWWWCYTDAYSFMNLIGCAKWVCTLGWVCRFRLQFLLVGSISRDFRYWEHPYLSQLSGLQHARHVKGHFTHPS